MKKNFTRARALYSNVAECADELTFTKGDILTVTDKEDETGWWECTNSDGASGGLVPSNYLVLIENEDEGVYNLPRKHFPQLEELYDELPVRNGPVGQHEGEEAYDVLPSREDVYDLPRGNGPIVNHPDSEEYDELPPREDVYDLPRLNVNNNNKEATTMGPIMEESDSDYDLPRPFLSPKGKPDDDYDELPKRPDLVEKRITQNSVRNSVASSTASSDTVSVSSLQIDATPLTLDNESAIEKLLRLKDGVDETVSRLLALFTSNWRAFAAKPPTQEERSKVCLLTGAMLTALRDFVDFARATLATVLAAPVVCKKTTSVITRRLQPIEEDVKILETTEKRLSEGQWDVALLMDTEKREGIPDDFDSFVMTTRATPDDVAELASYLYTNSQSIFRRRHGSSSSRLSQTGQTFNADPRLRPLPVAPLQRSPPKVTLDHDANDYDYVQFDEANENMSSLVPPAKAKHDPTRERLVTFYGQFGKVEIFLKGEIEMFCRIVRDQPPVKFVTLSKKIVKRANELVFIGDATCKVLQSCGRDSGTIADLSNRLQQQTVKTAQAVSVAAKSWPDVTQLERAIDATRALGDYGRSLKHAVYSHL